MRERVKQPPADNAADSGTPDGRAMNAGRILKIGIIGAVVTAVCCFTPVLVILFAAVGLSAAVGYLDYVLLPALAVFVGLIVFGVWQKYVR